MNQPDADFLQVRRAMITAIVIGVIGGAVVIPLAIGALAAATGNPDWKQAFAASALGTFFMASTTICVATLLKSSMLRAVTLGVYIWKCSLLTAVGLSLDVAELNRELIAACVGVSAVFFASVQAVVMTKTGRTNAAFQPRGAETL